MNIQNVNNQTSFLGLNYYIRGYKSNQIIQKNKTLAAFDKALKKSNFDINIAENSDRIASVTLTNKRENKIAAKFVTERLAKVSSNDERIVHYPIEGENKTLDIVYDSTAEAEKHAWEYNFGNPIIGKVQAAMDAVIKFSK